MESVVSPGDQQNYWPPSSGMCFKTYVVQSELEMASPKNKSGSQTHKELINLPLPKP
jgi:hypothetical protein